MASRPMQALKISCITFLISLFISYLSGFSLGIGLSLVILLIVISLGIAFDIIGTAVTAAEERPFHAMGADKVRGSREAIYLIRHADRVANFCNDVVGDIAGTVSGAMAASLALQLLQESYPFKKLADAALIALIAACTVGGKAAGKSYAINQANIIVFSVGKLISLFKFINTDLKKAKRKERANTRKVKKSDG